MFKLVKVKSLENGTILRPFLLYLGLEPKKRVVDDLVFECAEAAALLTYRDAQTVIRNPNQSHCSQEQNTLLRPTGRSLRRSGTQKNGETENRPTLRRRHQDPRTEPEKERNQRYTGKRRKNR